MKNSVHGLEGLGNMASQLHQAVVEEPPHAEVSDEASGGAVVAASPEGEKPATTKVHRAAFVRPVPPVVERRQSSVPRVGVDQRGRPKGMLSVVDFCTEDHEAFLAKLSAAEQKPENEHKPLVVVYTTRDKGFDTLELRFERLKGWSSLVFVWVQVATGVYKPLAKHIGKRFLWKEWSENFSKFDPEDIGINYAMPLVSEEAMEYANMLIDLISVGKPVRDKVLEQRANSRQPTRSPTRRVGSAQK